MGNFDFTCGVSGLPICEGTPIRLLLGVPRHTRAPSSQQEWHLSAFPLKGIYNGSGGADHLPEMNSTFEIGLWLRFFKTHARKQYLEFRDIPLEGTIAVSRYIPIQEQLTLDECFDFCQDKKLFVRCHQDTSFPLQLNMVREDVWQSLIRQETETTANNQEMTAQIRAFWNLEETFDTSYYLEHFPDLFPVYQNYWSQHTLLKMWEMAQFEGAKLPPEELASFFDVVSDTAMVLEQMYECRVMLRSPPAVNGPCYGNWGAHIAALEGWLEIAKREAEQRIAELGDIA